jgi:hypothetical protein
MLIKKHDKSRIVELEVTSSALVSSEAGIVTPNAFAAYPRERTFFSARFGFDYRGPIAIVFGISLRSDLSSGGLLPR